ncbi:MAG: DUF421 domain-containing protein [Candidatus Methylomirabilales bacterium]
MESVFRACFMYVFLWLVLRAAGKRTLAEATTFDFVLLLVISEASQQALLGNDFSVTHGVIIIVTLVLIDVLLSLLKIRFPRVDDVASGKAVVIVEGGRALLERMQKLRVDEDDVLEAARRLRGLERMDQIKYAVMEVNGGISVIPMEEVRRRAA